MSELKVLSPNGAWLNICDSDWQVLQDDGTWRQLEPGDDLRVRHGSNDYWLQILCEQDVGYCPPEQLAKCWPGYGGNFESTEFKTGGNTGYLLCDCDGLNCKTYTGHGPEYTLEGGRFFATSPIVEKTVAYQLPVTFFGSEAQVSEMLVYAGEHSGHIEVSLHDLDPGVRVRVYNDCVLLGDSDELGAYFNVFFNTELPQKAVEIDDCGDPEPPNKFLTVRVDAPAGARWRVKLGETNITQTTNYERPAPCFGTYGANLPCFVNENNIYVPEKTAYENVHYLPGSGRVDLDLTVDGTEPVTIQAIYYGQVIGQATTNNSASVQRASATMTFNFQPVGGDNFVVIRYTSKRANNQWKYSIYCPGQQGSRINKKAPMWVPNDVLCLPLNTSLDPAHAVVGQGAHTSDIHYDFSGQALGDVVVEFFAPDSVQFLFYQGNYPNEQLISGTPTIVNGHRRFYFRFNPANGTTVRVSVIGPCCPDWSFTMSRPVPPPVLSIRDAEIVRGGLGQVSLLCFDVVLSNRTPRRVTFDWDTSPLTAIVSEDGTCTVTEDVPDSPYCNIVATGVGRGGPYDNNTNIGYPQALQVSSSLHNPNCAVGGQYYVLETEINLPYTGQYTLVGTADDNLDVYINCVKVFQGPRYEDAWRGTHRGTFTAEAGYQTISAVYQNVPHCTVGWMKFVILDGNGAVVFATSPTAQVWVSKAGQIGNDPPPEPIVYGADYNKVNGSGAIEACTDSTRVCVPVCGTNLMGPDVTMQVTLSNVVNAEIGDLIGIGTIKNPNQFNCDQETNIAVFDAGPNQFINRGANSIFVSKLVADAGAEMVMDTDLYLPTSGLYTIFFHGADTAELYFDCNRVAVSTGNAVRVKTPLNNGVRKVYIKYTINPGKAGRAGYAAMAVVDAQNNIVYNTQAANWRGRILFAGTPPRCNQFAENCFISGNSIQEQQSGGGGSTGYTVGYGSVQVRSSLHGNGSQPNGINYSLQYTPNLPAGTYTIKWTADDRASFYINCQLIRNKDSNWRDIDTFQFTVPAGEAIFTIVYRNTGGSVAWCNWAILDANGNAVSVSRPGLPNEASAVGDVVAATVGERLGETYDTWRSGGLGWMIHRGGSIWGTGLNYAWWSAELDFNIPADGSYYIIATADDAVNLYIGCVGRPTNGTPFTLSAGPTKIHARVYNYKAKDACWFAFNLYRADGTIVYQGRAAGWKARPADLDFTGIS